MQTDDTLILANNNFTNIEKDAIKLAKIKIKDKEYLIFAYSLKFNALKSNLISTG